MELTTEPRARTWMEARTVICAVLILAVGEDEARRIDALGRHGARGRGHV